MAEQQSFANEEAAELLETQLEEGKINTLTTNQITCLDLFRRYG